MDKLFAAQNAVKVVPFAARSGQLPAQISVRNGSQQPRSASIPALSMVVCAGCRPTTHTNDQLLSSRLAVSPQRDRDFTTWRKA